MFPIAFALINSPKIPLNPEKTASEIHRACLPSFLSIPHNQALETPRLLSAEQDCTVPSENYFSDFFSGVYPVLLQKIKVLPRIIRTVCRDSSHRTQISCMVNHFLELLVISHALIDNLKRDDVLDRDVHGEMDL
jgi:hypothetical protein